LGVSGDEGKRKKFWSKVLGGKIKYGMEEIKIRNTFETNPAEKRRAEVRRNNLKEKGN